MELLLLVGGYVIISGTILFLLFQWNMNILGFFSSCSANLRGFISENAGFFKIAFMLAFFLEQFFFLLFMALYLNISVLASAFVGLVSLIVITTASFQSFIWEYKFQISETEKRLLKSALQLIKRYSKKIDEFQK